MDELRPRDAAEAETLRAVEAEARDEARFRSKRDALGRWAKGNPGRKKGSRNRLTNELAMSLLDDFHCFQEDNIERLRRWFFPQYVQLMARFLPRETRAPHPDFASYTPEETARVAARARSALDLVDARAGSLDAVLAALEHDPAPTPAQAAQRLANDISKSVEYGVSTETAA